MTVNDAEYRVIRLLGKGKGGYSYLVTDGTAQEVFEINRSDPIRQEIHKMLHPNAVTMVRMNGKKVGADTMRSINIYFSAYVFIIIVSVLLVSLDNFDFATSFSGVLTTINNVGPGISQVGPTDNFHAFSALSKIVFSFDMLFGRLEIFPYLLILSPDLWRKRF